MKGYTDLSQSKKLAEILPLESADMCWQKIYDENHLLSDYRIELLPFRLYSCLGVPAWSLAALLDILYQVKEIKHQRVTILVGGFAGQQWYVEFVKVQDEKSVLLEHSKELVDACYEMIIKLHEQKLL